MAMTDQAQHGAGHQSVAGRRFTGALTSWERHPADLARFLVASLVCMAGVALTLAEPEGVQSTSSDLVLLFDQLPNLVTQVVVGILQVAALVAPVGAILYMRRGRWAELALAVAAAVVAGLAAAVLTGALADAVPPQIIADGRQPSWVTGSAFPSGSYLAAIAAAVTTIAPMLTLSWRRAARWTVVTVAIARVITAVEAPLNLIATVSLGVAIGSLALVAVGAPSRRPAASSIVSALADAGLVVDDLQPSAASTSHGPAYTAYVGDRRVFVKVVGRDERDADLLSRFVRIVRVKGVEDDRPLNPRLTVEREALNALMAAHAGASVPSVLAVGETDERGAFLALDHLDGVRLSDLSDDQLTTDVLASAFAQLAVLHGARIAHQWASTDQFLLRDDGSVSMLDFRWAELAANDDQLARDLAEMLASVSVKVGPQRTVAAAATHFSPTELAAALPLLQPLAVSSTTRNALRHDKQLIAALRTEVQTTAGVDEFEMLEMQRLTVRKVVGFVALLVIGNLLLGFVANFDDIWQEVKGADFSTLPLMFLMVALSYAGGAISLMGAVNVRLPFFRTTEIMFAQSFLNRFIPAHDLVGEVRREHVVGQCCTEHRQLLLVGGEAGQGGRCAARHGAQPGQFGQHLERRRGTRGADQHPGTGIDRVVDDIELGRAQRRVELLDVERAADDATSRGDVGGRGGDAARLRLEQRREQTGRRCQHAHLQPITGQLRHGRGRFGVGGHGGAGGVGSLSSPGTRVPGWLR